MGKKKKAKKRPVEHQRELIDLHEGIKAALTYHLRSGANPVQAVELVADNLDEQGRREMIELGLLTMVEALATHGDQ
jgi:hypothetical protein